MHKAIDLHRLAEEKNDVYYKIKEQTVKNIKDIFVWAKENCIRTKVTMLNISHSCGRVKSDKDFSTVLNLINKSSSSYFRIILRKNTNLFGILYNEKIIGGFP